MKLVGATDWFIRWPFVIEGIVARRARRRCWRSCCCCVGKIALLDPLHQRLRADRRARRRSTSALLVARAARRVASACRAAGLGPLAAPLPAGLTARRQRRGAPYPVRSCAASRRPRSSRSSPSWSSCCCSAPGSAGATPTGCPGRCATRSSATSDTAVVARGDRPRPRHLLPQDPEVDAGRRRASPGVVAHAATTASPTTSTRREYKRFQRGAELASSRASACRSRRHPKRPARRRGLRRLAGQARRPAAGRRHRRGRRARRSPGLSQRGRRRADQGPAGHAT